MNSNFTQQNGADLRCYRLRTARQKKRMQYKDRDKQLIQLGLEEQLLHKQLRQLGWEPLIPPVQKGWVRQFVLREDVLKSRYADFFEGILRKINTYQYDWRKDFKKKKKKRGRKIYVVKEQLLLKPCEKDFIKMQFSEAEKGYFFQRWEMNKHRQLIKHYVFTEPWRFTLKVKPNIITKVRKRDVVIESRLSEIRDYLQKNDLRNRLCKVRNGYAQYRPWREIPKQTEIDPFKNKSLVQLMDLINDRVDPEYVNTGTNGLRGLAYT